MAYYSQLQCKVSLQALWLMRHFSYLIGCSMNTEAKIYVLMISSPSHLLILVFKLPEKNRSELLTDVDTCFEGDGPNLTTLAKVPLSTKNLKFHLIGHT